MHLAEPLIFHQVTRCIIFKFTNPVLIRKRCCRGSTQCITYVLNRLQIITDIGEFNLWRTGSSDVPPLTASRT